MEYEGGGPLSRPLIVCSLTPLVFWCDIYFPLTGILGRSPPFLPRLLHPFSTPQIETTSMNGACCFLHHTNVISSNPFTHSTYIARVYDRPPHIEEKQRTIIIQSFFFLFLPPLLLFGRSLTATEKWIENNKPGGAKLLLKSPHQFPSLIA